MRVTISRFRCISEGTYEFPVQEHTLLDGDSGLGKSTLMNAILWCLYGGMQHVYPGQTKPTAATATKVELFLPEFNNLKIIRTKPPEQVTVQIEGQAPITGETAKQQIEKFFGTRRLWIATSYISQGDRSPLMTLSNAEKLELLQELAFGSDVAEKTPETPEWYLERIEEEMGTVKVQLDKSTNDFNVAHGQYELMLDQLETKGYSWESEPTKEDLEQLREQVLEKEAELTAIREQLLQDRETKGRKQLLLESLTQITQTQAQLTTDWKQIQEDGIPTNIDKLQRWIRVLELQNQLQTLMATPPALESTTEEIALSLEEVELQLATLRAQVPPVKTAVEICRRAKIPYALEAITEKTAALEQQLEQHHSTVLAYNENENQRQKLEALRSKHQVVKDERSRREEKLHHSLSRLQKVFLFPIEATTPNLLELVTEFFQEQEQLRQQVEQVRILKGNREKVETRWKSLESRVQKTMGRWDTEVTIIQRQLKELSVLKRDGVDSLESFQALRPSIQELKQRQDRITTAIKLAAALKQQMEKLESLQSQLAAQEEILTTAETRWLELEIPHAFPSNAAEGIAIQVAIANSQKLLECPSCHAHLELQHEHLILSSNQPMAAENTEQTKDLLQTIQNAYTEFDTLMTKYTMESDRFNGLEKPDLELLRETPIEKGKLTALEQKISELEIIHREFRNLQQQLIEIEGELAALPSIDESLLQLKTMPPSELNLLIPETHSILALQKEIQTQTLSLAEFESQMKELHYVKMDSPAAFNKREVETILKELRSVQLYPFNLEELEARVEHLQQLQKYLQWQRKLQPLKEQLGEDQNLEIPLTAKKIKDRVSKLERHSTEMARLEQEKLDLEVKLQQLPKDQTENLLQKEEILKDEIANLEMQRETGKEMIEVLRRQKQLERMQAKQMKLATREATLQQMKILVGEVTNQALQVLVDNINHYTNSIIGDLFDDEIQISLKLFKELKTKDKVKSQVNLQIQYKGNTYDDVSHLSGGERDRLSLALTIALALSSPSPILMMDECLASLDGERRNTCIETIRSYLAHKTCISVCHETVKGVFDAVMTV
jgi:DNA repair exonuclease SbcCD ATPase subunit